jgi:hypothetical protein
MCVTRDAHGVIIKHAACFRDSPTSSQALLRGQNFANFVDFTFVVYAVIIFESYLSVLTPQP